MDARTQIAALAMQGLLAHGPTGEPADVYAEDAAMFADALLARLAETAPDAAPQPEPVGRADTGWRLTIIPPKGHEWVAQDEDMTWCYYTRMPDLFDEYWNTTGAFYGETARHAPYPGPWTEALFRWIDGEWVRWDRKNDCPKATPTPPPKTSFQARVVEWRDACFGDNPTEPHERGDRLLEEVLEFLQSRGYPADRAPPLVDYVYGRPSGEPEQEVGGILLTLALSCHEAGLDMAAAGEAELTRVWGKIDAIREKQATKPAGPLPSARTTPPDADGEGVTLSEAVMGAIGRALRHGGGLVDLLQRETIARAAIATDRAERPVVLPPGWVAVPRELTVDMWDADEASDRNNLEEVWEAILAAAPPCPGVKDGKGDD